MPVDTRPQVTPHEMTAQIDEFTIVYFGSYVKDFQEALVKDIRSRCAGEPRSRCNVPGTEETRNVITITKNGEEIGSSDAWVLLHILNDIRSIQGPYRFDMDVSGPDRFLRFVRPIRRTQEV